MNLFNSQSSLKKLLATQAVVTTRVAGASLISMSWLSWVIRNSDRSAMQKQIIQMFAIFQSLVFIILLHGQFVNLGGLTSWPPVFIHFSFAFSFVFAWKNYQNKTTETA
ncbi:MAG: hypothetical protein COW24_00960 [Candidatus Kerfeldbacteria bacterium CG15_BIG_FIL_POST_REV_8_21_14_020_45_12]|uniref:Uncharacterized protein n=1 Tax=Candidatus Kerfeldbacteria bacterium CG15_BIG_FIL_POST_REV_8_21_14_020_45_12 TaxID=2014247 RepID=A0A2M7H4V4_9BACT|nr:MAG: hypothetical protein COW24_00960 [Candidatus Kerfeldbacteria bacterium CG15_BIG_FIL_POST_REV_8_21_14_020_45_12]